MTEKRVDPLSKENIIERLIKGHTHWYNEDKLKSPFNYQYLRKLDSSLISAIDRKIFGIKGLPHAFELAGINPLCHLTGVLYGKTARLQDKKKHFLNTLYYLALEVGDPKELNDSNINSRQTLILPPAFYDGRSYKVCEECKCEILPVTFQSIYAEGRRLYGDWGSALAAAGFNYKSTRRKRPKYTRQEVMSDLLLYFKEANYKWSTQTLRKTNHALYKGIFNSHQHSLFFFANRPVMETAIIELQFYLKKESEPYLSVELFYEAHKGS
jgi:hypothetical protein